MESEINDFLESLETVEVVNMLNNFKKPRIYRERANEFDKYDDHDLFIRYGLSKERLYLLQKIEHLLEYKNDKNKSVPAINHLLCAPRYFATGNFLMTIGDLGGVSVATSCCIIKRVATALVTLRQQFIRFHETQEEITSD